MLDIARQRDFTALAPKGNRQIPSCLWITTLAATTYDAIKLAKRMKTIIYVFNADNPAIFCDFRFRKLAQSSPTTFTIVFGGLPPLSHTEINEIDARVRTTIDNYDPQTIIIAVVQSVFLLHLAIMMKREKEVSLVTPLISGGYEAAV